MTPRRTGARKNARSVGGAAVVAPATESVSTALGRAGGRPRALERERAGPGEGQDDARSHAGEAVDRPCRPRRRRCERNGKEAREKRTAVTTTPIAAATTSLATATTATAVAASCLDTPRGGGGSRILLALDGGMRIPARGSGGGSSALPRETAGTVPAALGDGVLRGWCRSSSSTGSSANPGGTRSLIAASLFREGGDGGDSRGRTKTAGSDHGTGATWTLTRAPAENIRMFTAVIARAPPYLRPHHLVHLSRVTTKSAVTTRRRGGAETRRSDDGDRKVSVLRNIDHRSLIKSHLRPHRLRVLHEDVVAEEIAPDQRVTVVSAPAFPAAARPAAEANEIRPGNTFLPPPPPPHPAGVIDDVGTVIVARKPG